MAKNNAGTDTTANLESRITSLEKRIAPLEKLSKRFIRRQRAYTDEQRAAIRARLLAGQEAARKGREAKVTAKPEAIKTEKAKKVNEVRPIKKSEPAAALKVSQSSSQGATK